MPVPLPTVPSSPIATSGESALSTHCERGELAKESCSSWKLIGGGWGKGSKTANHTTEIETNCFLLIITFVEEKNEYFALSRLNISSYNYSLVNKYIQIVLVTFYAAQINFSHFGITPSRTGVVSSSWKTVHCSTEL